MKLNIFALSCLLLFVSMDGSAQSNSTSKTILSISQRSGVSELPLLPIRYQMNKEAVPSPPLFRIPQSYYKQYVIRVLQLDHRSLRQYLFIDMYVYSAKSKDHDGYDYFLPVSFAKKEWGESFVAKLPKYLKEKAVLMKLDPNNPSCNCFSKF